MFQLSRHACTGWCLCRRRKCPLRLCQALLARMKNGGGIEGLCCSSRCLPPLERSRRKMHLKWNCKRRRLRFRMLVMIPRLNIGLLDRVHLELYSLLRRKMITESISGFSTFIKGTDKDLFMWRNEKPQRVLRVEFKYLDLFKSTSIYLIFYFKKTFGQIDTRPAILKLVNKLFTSLRILFTTLIFKYMLHK